MGHVTSLFVRKVVAQVDERLGRAALLRSVGIDPTAPVDPKLMISDQEYYSLLETIAAREPDACSLPLRVGASMRCDDYGAFGLAWKTARTLERSFDRAVRYARVLTSVALYEVETVEDGAYFHLHRDGPRRLGLRLSNEATLASVVAISNQVSKSPVRFTEVHLKHPAPESIDAHTHYFGCPLHFDSDRDALRVDDESLTAPNVLGDPAISSFFDHHLESEVSELKREASLDGRARRLIRGLLSEGVPTLTEVAARLGMSGRTLQRRLAGQGSTFQELVDDSRRTLAHELLRRTDYSLAEVAFMTGFAEQSSFTRAFRRWAGQTPRSYRLTVSALDG